MYQSIKVNDILDDRHCQGVWQVVDINTPTSHAEIMQVLTRNGTTPTRRRMKIIPIGWQHYNVVDREDLARYREYEEQRHQKQMKLHNAIEGLLP